MLVESTVSGEAQEPFASVEAAGQALKCQRMSLGLAAHSVEYKLRLQPGYIEALEQAQWSSLPGPVFLRGYLLAYCKLLGVESAPYLVVYETEWMQANKMTDKSSLGKQAFHREMVMSTSNSDDPKADGSKRAVDAGAALQTPSLWWHFYGILLTVVVLVMVWGWPNWQAQPQWMQPLVAWFKNDPKEAVEVIAVPEEPVMSLDDAVFQQELHALLVAQEETVTSSYASEPVVVTRLGRPNTWLVGQPSGQPQDTLELFFLRDTQIEIVDSLGHKEVSNTHVSGALLKVGGLAPFTITVVDSEAVMIKFNQRSVYLSAPSVESQVDNEG